MQAITSERPLTPLSRRERVPLVSEKYKSKSVYLKPCPFCGSTRIRETKLSAIGSVIIECGSCGCNQGLFSEQDKERAYMMWNLRINDS